MPTQALQQIQGDRLLVSASLASGFESGGMPSLAFGQNSFVKSAHGRLAQFVGAQQQFARSSGLALASEFLNVEQFAQQMGLAKGVACRAIASTVG